MYRAAVEWQVSSCLNRVKNSQDCSATCFSRPSSLSARANRHGEAYRKRRVGVESKTATLFSFDEGDAFRARIADVWETKLAFGQTTAVFDMRMNELNE